MGLDVELEYQTEIKAKINSLLWEVLPGGATMQEAEDAASAFWGKIVKLREKYKCAESVS